MSITEITIANSSALHPIRVSVQRRKPFVAPTPEAPPARARAPDAQMTLEERAAFEQAGSEVIDVEQDLPFKQTRTVRMPRWQADGEPTLSNWVTKQWTAAGRVPTFDKRPPAIQRLSEEWGEPHTVDTVPQRGETKLRCDDSLRFVLENPDPDAFVTFHNPTSFRWFALRQLDKNGKVTETTNVGPGQQGRLLLGKLSAVIEQRPT